MAVPNDVIKKMSPGERRYYELRKQESLQKYWDEHLDYDQWCEIVTVYLTLLMFIGLLICSIIEAINVK